MPLHKELISWINKMLKVNLISRQPERNPLSRNERTPQRISTGILNRYDNNIVLIYQKMRFFKLTHIHSEDSVDTTEAVTLTGADMKRLALFPACWPVKSLIWSVIFHWQACVHVTKRPAAEAWPLLWIFISLMLFNFQSFEAKWANI